jgi:hypothetical protein
MSNTKHRMPVRGLDLFMAVSVAVSVMLQTIQTAFALLNYFKR